MKAEQAELPSHWYSNVQVCRCQHSHMHTHLFNLIKWGVGCSVNETSFSGWKGRALLSTKWFSKFDKINRWHLNRPLSVSVNLVDPRLPSTHLWLHLLGLFAWKNKQTNKQTHKNKKTQVLWPLRSANIGEGFVANRQKRCSSDHWRYVHNTFSITLVHVVTCCTIRSIIHFSISEGKKWINVYFPVSCCTSQFEGGLSVPIKHLQMDTRENSPNVH